MKVYKNNMRQDALLKRRTPNIDDMLAGTCAYVFYGEDVEPAKVIKEQSEKLKKMNFIGAIADGKALSADEVKPTIDRNHQAALGSRSRWSHQRLCPRHRRVRQGGPRRPRALRQCRVSEQKQAA